MNGVCVGITVSSLISIFYTLVWTVQQSQRLEDGWTSSCHIYLNSFAYMRPRFWHGLSYIHLLICDLRASEGFRILTVDRISINWVYREHSSFSHISAKPKPNHIQYINRAPQTIITRGTHRYQASDFIYSCETFG